MPQRPIQLHNYPVLFFEWLNWRHLWGWGEQWKEVTDLLLTGNPRVYLESSKDFWSKPRMLSKWHTLIIFLKSLGFYISYRGLRKNNFNFFKASTELILNYLRCMTSCATTAFFVKRGRLFPPHRLVSGSRWGLTLPPRGIFGTTCRQLWWSQMGVRG